MKTPNTKIEKSITFKCEIDKDFCKHKAIHILSCGHPRISIIKSVDTNRIFYSLDTSTGCAEVSNGLLELAVEISKDFDSFFEV